MTTTKPSATTQETQVDGDFQLTADQMELMINIDSVAEQADREDNFSFFDELVASDDWKRRFGAMSWDQAYDRYEIMIGRCADC